MRASESIDLISAALVAVQAEIKHAAKDSTNPHFKSKYSDLASVWDAARDALRNRDVAVIQAPVHSDDGRVHLTTRLLHDSGQWLEETASIPITKQDPHGYGSGLTYLRRYSLAAMVGVVSDDDDGNAAAEAPPKKQKYGANGAEVNKIELEMMTPAEQKRMHSHAAAVIDLCNDDKPIQAASYCAIQLTTHEEKMAVWALLPSEVRSAIKSHTPKPQLATQA